MASWTMVTVQAVASPANEKGVRKKSGTAQKRA